MPVNVKFRRVRSNAPDIQQLLDEGPPPLGYFDQSLIPEDSQRPQRGAPGHLVSLGQVVCAGHLVT